MARQIKHPLFKPEAQSSYPQHPSLHGLCSLPEITVLGARWVGRWDPGGKLTSWIPMSMDSRFSLNILPVGTFRRVWESFKSCLEALT